MTGSVNSYTPHFRFKKINFNISPWHDLEWSNWAEVDALLYTYLNISNVQGIWQNATAYTVGQRVIDDTNGRILQCLVNHTSVSAPSTLADDIAAHPTYWQNIDILPKSRGAWATGTLYSSNDYVSNGYKYAVCLHDHTAGADFNADATAGYWSVICDFTAHVTTAQTAATNAANSATAAATSEANALAAKDTAVSSATAAADSETNALAYKSAALLYANNAAASEVNAGASKVAAANSASSAATNATNAVNAAGTATTQAGIATTKAAEAAASASVVSYRWCGTATGTANALILTPPTPLTSIVSGTTVDFIAASSNTGAVTVGISGLGAVAVKMPDGTALPANTIQAGVQYTLKYNGTEFRLSGGSGGVASSSLDQFLLMGA